ncbi:PREDICTED: uncharacterized protein LOC105143270 [Acromyrmex echinatior]|uniref:uncharacterized protein LOC105143270 n=1 Tax=Acromyrmex echinatior TaxID=103372 RepID=UPI000580C0B4|nr:PREDICTED: uncharacterized protein LOC105143270 [Acromyrmex echinatior]
MQCESAKFLDNPFTMKELLLAIDSAKTRSAPGADPIDYNIIKNLTPDTVFLCYYKSITTFFVKEFSLRNGISQWSSLSLNQMEKGAFINNALTICAFLDIEGAFDNMIPSILIEDLQRLGIPPKTVKFISNLLFNRQITFICDGVLKGPYITLKGTPQEGLEVSPSKTQWMLFTKKRQDIELHIQNIEIPRVQSVIFLGFTLDPKLSGKEHLKTLVNKRHNLTNILAALAGTKWGSHPSLLLILYRAVFRSAIEYGCQVFKLKGNKTEFLQLERLVNRNLRLAFGFRLSTPISVIMAEAKETPLNIRFGYMTSKFIYKAFSRKNSPVLYSFESLEQAAYSPSRRQRALAVPAFKNYNHNRGPIIYTDGSKTVRKDRVGFTIYSPDLNVAFKFKLPPETSIFSAESWTILQAINLIEDRCCDEASICSDSLSALQAISSHNSRNANHITLDIKDRLSFLTQHGFKINFIWTPGHKGIISKETAEHLANEVALSGHRPKFKIPFQDFFMISKQFLNTKFQAHLDHCATFKGQLYDDFIEITQPSPDSIIRLLKERRSSSSPELDLTIII